MITTLRQLTHTIYSYIKKEWGGTILFMLFIIVPLKSSIADTNWVPSGSMNPTIMEGDLVYIDKLAYDLRLPLTLKSLKHNSDPQHGDIAVLFSPEDNTRLVKRVIGLPNDTIELRNNHLLINGIAATYTRLETETYEAMEEPLRSLAQFADEQVAGKTHPVMSVPNIPTPLRNFGPITIPKGHYFVMGDNRDNSKDSRIFGVVERKQFVGKAERVVVSMNFLDKYQPRFNRFFQALN
ncbi:MAG TPA: signal peptidase I [Opitutae bacterium]|nr:signal peptidase I [Opitutae bacterium]